jgi:hypothetical protein
MKLYEIVFSGQLVPGAQADRVQANLAKLFQADAQRLALLFSGRRLVLKNNLDQATAEKYRSTMERAGAVAEIVAMPVEAQAGVEAPAQVPDPVRVQERNRAPDEMEVEEVELAPPPDEPNWARKAAMSSARPAGVASGQARPSQVQPRDVYMAAFVDVEAPDFSIGALGSDVQEAKPATPAPRLDLSGLSLAPAGSDLEPLKAPTPAPAPDTSHLSLVKG